MTALVRLACSSVVMTALTLLPLATTSAQGDGWVTIFDGKTLNGWKVGENADTFSVQDGHVQVLGPRAHLFYAGEVGNHDFKNFEWRAEVMTFPGANSGMYIHTEYQETGWPQKGYEIQVNNSHTDPIRTGSLYNVVKVEVPPAQDNEWFTQHITVQGKRITARVNGKQVMEYTEPDDLQPPANMPQRRLSSGTVALQGHDPKSRVLYRNIQVKLLP
jgi:hypothetical protein